MNSFSLLVLFVNSCTVISYSTFDYCNFHKTHNLCGNNMNVLAKECIKYEHIDVPNAAKKILRNVHTEIRSKLAKASTGFEDMPCASNMYLMKWSSILEKTALASVHRCNVETNSDPQNRILVYVYTKENGEKSSSHMDVAETIVVHSQNNSFPEFQLNVFMYDILAQKQFYKTDIYHSVQSYYEPFDRNNTKRRLTHLGDKDDIVNFVNMISANSFMMGCAFGKYVAQPTYHIIYVCHYAPAAEKNSGFLYRNKLDTYNGINPLPYCEACYHCKSKSTCFKKYALCNSKDLKLTVLKPINIPTTSPRTTTSTRKTSHNSIKPPSTLYSIIPSLSTHSSIKPLSTHFSIKPSLSAPNSAVAFKLHLFGLIPFFGEIIFIYYI